MQATSLKALAQAVLERNQPCNHDATTTKKPCNSTTEKAPLQLHQGGGGNQLHNLSKVAPKLRGDATKITAQQQAATEHSCIVSLCGNATTQPGAKWCRENLGSLLAAGWTERELFNPGWPLGLAMLSVFERPGVAVTLEAGKVVFVIPRHNSESVQQVARPLASIQ